MEISINKAELLEVSQAKDTNPPPVSFYGKLTRDFKAYLYGKLTRDFKICHPQDLFVTLVWVPSQEQVNFYHYY